MRNFLKKTTIFLFIFLVLPVFVQSEEITKTIEGGIAFDWISKTQMQRDANIKQIQDILFSQEESSNYSKKEFRKKYSEFLKDENHLNNYTEIRSGKKEDKDNYYCGFYRGKLFVAYGIQDKNDLRKVYYYDAMGTLRWVDVFSDNYPDFPYWSYQYYRNGKIVAAYYYISDYDQYIFDENKKFKGRWYKDKMYNKNAKVIMTRSNY